MNRIASVCLVSLFLALFFIMPENSLFAGKSVLDTIHDATDQGKSEELSDSSSADDGKVLQAQSDISIDRLREIINQIIRAINARNGGGIGGKTTVQIPTVPQKPQLPPITVPTTPIATPTPSVPVVTATQTASVPAVNTISGIKARIRAKFGIDCKDGDGAAWTEKQLLAAEKVYETLPNIFLRCTKTAQRDSVFMSPNVLGYVKMGIPTVHLMNSCVREKTFEATLVHEMVHCFQSSNMHVANAWQKQFWPNGQAGGPVSSSVSSYGNSQPLEDMAESVRSFWQDGKSMKSRYPDRYDFIKNYVMSGREY
ncbi:MAG: hypothetical protein HQM10_15055 [Candidatus Riflebacteria bacterium]|nr:hypothetical protein [Candidatus Riflebacteria bacterium]